MKWLIYGAGLLLSSALLTALSMSGLAASLGGACFGIVTVVVYFLGVFFLPRRIIARISRRKAAAPAPVEDVAVREPPASEVKEMKRRPLRRDVVGYQLAIFVLAGLLLLACLNIGSRSSEIERLQAELEDEYHAGYNDGYAEGESSQGGEYYSCFSSGFSAGVAANSSGSIITGDDIEKSYLQWLADAGFSFSEWSDAKHDIP